MSATIAFEKFAVMMKEMPSSVHNRPVSEQILGRSLAKEIIEGWAGAIEGLDFIVDYLRRSILQLMRRLTYNSPLRYDWRFEYIDQNQAEFFRHNL